jgi:hypothetical protein
MENYQRITKGLKEGQYTTNPHEAAADLSILAGEYAYASGQLELIFQRKPGIWSEMRKNFQSDTACERAWESTVDGMTESGLRLRVRAIEKMMSALKSLLRLAENESRNIL